MVKDLLNGKEPLMNACKILLVDDEEDIVNLIEEVLISDGFVHIYKA